MIQQLMLAPRSRVIAATLGVAMLCGSSATARVLTFDTADGFTPFVSLFGQPSSGPTWSGAGELWTVQPRDPGDPASGDNVIQSLAVPGDSSPFSRMIFEPDDAFLGGSAATTGVFDFRFEIRNDAAPASEDFGVSQIIRLASDPSDQAPFRMNIFDNGRVQLQTLFGAVNVLDGLGANLDLDDRTGEFLTVEGQLDFDNAIYTISVDGVQQFAGPSADFAFLASPQADFGLISLGVGNSTDDPRRQISIDNLSVSVENPILFGDYNNDGSVDAADYTVWRDGGTLQNETAAPLGVNNLADYVAWAGNYGAVSGSAVAVPEPVAASLLVVASVLVRRSPRRRTA